MNGILCADMDNTIIYSYKRNIGENKLNVELYNGREISFISEKTHDLLKKVSEKMTIIPHPQGRKNSINVLIWI